MGYVEGLEHGRELLLQEGFNHGYYSGSFAGFNDTFWKGALGYARSAKMQQALLSLQSACTDCELGKVGSAL